MHYQTVTLDAFYIAGIAVRTTNAGGQSQKDIGALWQQFYSSNIIEQIPEKQSHAIYCVYTNYESDASGAYTTLIGCRVPSLNNLPQGITGTIIPPATYQLYTATGKLPDCVLDTWMHIWQASINRKYAADFDVYGEKAQNPDQAQVQTYLSVHS
jgi:predicted transcriptional regulator YdeE